MKLRITLLALAISAGAVSTSTVAETPKTVDAALAQAKKTHQPVLIDFSAPWCYSCYFMATHVLNGTEWNALEAKTVVASVDADSPDGAAWSRVDFEVFSGINGVSCGAPGEVALVGFGSFKARLVDGVWKDEFDLEPYGVDFHAVWADKSGAFWAVGGDFGQDHLPGCRRPSAAGRGPTRSEVFRSQSGRGVRLWRVRSRRRRYD